MVIGASAGPRKTAWSRGISYRCSWPEVIKGTSKRNPIPSRMVKTPLAFFIAQIPSQLALIVQKGKEAQVKESEFFLYSRASEIDTSDQPEQKRLSAV